eukprot:2278815-Pleurochrysis_carterae.AAC.11
MAQRQGRQPKLRFNIMSCDHVFQTTSNPRDLGQLTEEMVGQDHRRLVLKVVRFDGAFKVLRPRRRVVIRMRNVLAEGEPAAADVVVLAKELEAPGE